MVAGTGRFTTNLMREFGGDLLARRRRRRLRRRHPAPAGSVAAGPGRDRNRAQDRGRRGAGTGRRHGRGDAPARPRHRSAARQPCAGCRRPSETSAATWSRNEPVFSLDLFAAAGGGPGRSWRAREDGPGGEAARASPRGVHRGPARRDAPREDAPGVRTTWPLSRPVACRALAAPGASCRTASIFPCADRGKLAIFGSGPSSRGIPRRSKGAHPGGTSEVLFAGGSFSVGIETVQLFRRPAPRHNDVFWNVSALWRAWPSLTWALPPLEWDWLVPNRLECALPGAGVAERQDAGLKSPAARSCGFDSRLRTSDLAQHLATDRTGPPDLPSEICLSNRGSTFREELTAARNLACGGRMSGKGPGLAQGGSWDEFRKPPRLSPVCIG